MSKDADTCVLSEPVDFEKLDGKFCDFRYDDPFDESVPLRGAVLYMRYRDIGDCKETYTDGWDWFMPKYTSGSHYAGDTATLSNYEVLLERALELDADPSEVPDECRPWCISLSGAHGTYAIAFHVKRTPQDIRDMLDGSYPLIDEDHLSNLENERENEAWDNWAEDDYRRALEKAFEEKIGHLYDGDFELDFDAVDDVGMGQNFYEAVDSSGESWEHSSEGAYIDVEKIAEYVASDGDIDDLPEGTKVLGTRRNQKQRLLDFLAGPKKRGDMNGLSGDVLDFPGDVRRNRMDLDLIRSAVTNVRQHSDLTQKPDVFAVVIEHWFVDLSGTPGESAPRLLCGIIGYTHDPQYAEEMAQVLYDTLAEPTEALTGVYVIVGNETVFRQVKT